jgi:hypothetical protein
MRRPITIFPVGADLLFLLLLAPAVAAQQSPVRPGRTLRLDRPVVTLPEVMDATLVLQEGNRRFGRRWIDRGAGAGGAAMTGAEVYTVGQRRKFWSIDFSKGLSFPYAQYEVEAECREVGTHAYYFIEVKELDNVSSEALQEFVTAFETSSPNSPRPGGAAKGIYQNVTEVFGDPPDIDGDPRIVLLLTKIPSIAQQAADEKMFGGYFYSANQSPTDPVDFGGGVKQRSNKTEMMYVNSQLVD